MLRIASLLFPSAVAWEVASMELRRTALDQAVAWALGPLCLATIGALVVRAVDVRVRRRAERSGVSWADTLEVLTASGSSLAWTGAAAILLSTCVGWASLSIVGLFALCTVHLVALWTLLRASGGDPWRRASLTRRFVPALAVEGETVTEAVSLVAPRIPVGFRLFARGRLGQGWSVSRYVVPAGDSAGEVLLESEVGPARRGAHDAEPLEVWLEDVLGLCRSPCVRAGAARLMVVPKPASVVGAPVLPHRGGVATDARPAMRLPTEGSFRLREYQPGDDARRIHWLRSLAARQIVVRLPDEVPHDQPGVRLVLDTFHPGLASSTDALACTSPGDLLDALVRVWLGVGRALVGRGLRVTAIAAVAERGGLEVASRLFDPRRIAEAQKLGARVSWQASMAPTALLTEAPAVVVSHRLPLDDAECAARWVVVPGALWTTAPSPRTTGALLLPHPLGSVDNRRSRRRLALARAQRERADHEVFRMLSEHPQTRRAGHLLARPGAARSKSADPNENAGSARSKSADPNENAGSARSKSADPNENAGAARSKSADPNERAIARLEVLS
jgi:uncharacterized protein (DUF58 family)